MVRLMAGLLKPKNKILGIDVAGKVEAVGVNVDRFQPGDEVFGSSSHGCFAEYVSVPHDELVIKPKVVAFDEAAAVHAAALVALQGLRDHGQIEPGQQVLINGASGGVGTFAVQIAKAFGAEVTAVCSTHNLELVRCIGADHAIDYTEEDFTRSGQQYDLIFDTVAKRTFAECKSALKPLGVYVTTEFSPAIMLHSKWVSMKETQRMAPMLATRNPDDLAVLRDLLEAGKIKPVIDRRYRLDQVSEALRYLGRGHAKGKVIITCV